MKLRDRVRGHWPPSWASSYGRGTTFDTSEEGILRAVALMPAMGSQPERLRLEVEHKGTPSTGVLALNHQSLHAELHEVLRNNLGKTIRELGDLELSDS